MSSTQKILVATWVHNGEKTIAMAIDSILNQTHQNFVHYIIDNASTDGTAEIVKNYAKHDSRIKYLPREVNSCDLTLYNWVIDNINEDYDYFANLDADDEYTSDFMEKTLAFANIHDLDIACGGAKFIDAATKKHVETRKLPDNLLLTDAKTFQENFSDYYFYHARQIWGKIYRKSVITTLDLKSHPHSNLSHGADTIFCLAAFQVAERVGILAEAFYMYYLSPSSLSGSISHSRIESGDILYEANRAFMENKFGEVTDENQRSLYFIYLAHTFDTFGVIAGANVDLEVKLDNLYRLFSCKRVAEALACVNMEVRNQLMQPVAQWIHVQNAPEGTSNKLQKLSDLLSKLDRIISAPPNLSHLCRSGNTCDDKFFTLLSAIMTRSEEHLMLAAVQNAKALQIPIPDNYEEMCKYLKNNVEQIFNAYQNTADDNAKINFTENLARNMFYSK